MKRKKILFPVIILFNYILLQNCLGQGQINITDYISQRFQNYCASVPREEVYIHTDREEYIAGEDLWFNAFLFDRQQMKASSTSKIVYFELLNPDKRAILQKRIIIDNGSGPGQLVLPDTLSSGIYTIRAYTNWMKNFLPYNCFLKEIRVHNTFSMKAFIKYNKDIDKNIITADTSIFKTGLSMSVNNLKPDTLEINIQTDEKFRTENDNKIWLFIQTHGIIDQQRSERTDSDFTKILIPKELLSSGINHISVFDSKGFVCERFIYTPENAVRDITINSIDTCSKRDKVIIGIDSKSARLSGLSNLSISVSPYSSNKTVTNLDDYLIFGTEFGLGPFELIKGRTLADIPAAEMDSIMLTLKSNWIIWERIFSDEAQSFKYPHEKQEHYLSGRLLTGNMQAVNEGEIIVMSTPGKEPVFQYARTDIEGNFHLKVNIDEELKDLIIQPDIYDRNQKIYFESSFSDNYFDYVEKDDTSSKHLSPFIAQMLINYQVRKIYGLSSAVDSIAPAGSAVKEKRFYGKPDFELIMKDFITLDSMQEVFFELIPHVAFERIYSYYEISILDGTRTRLPEGTPALMIDGVIIKNPSVIARLDPELVEKIQVVWDPYRVGGYIFNGIINVISKTGDFSIGTLPDDAVRLHYRVINKNPVFASPDYSLSEMYNSPLADFRNTLYWDPSVRPDPNGNAECVFWSADIKYDYLITIQGIAPDGNAVSLKKIITVK